jgi:peptide/nickel transport system substrate-binding protein
MRAKIIAAAAAALLLGATCVPALLTTQARAETVLRHDESAPGELDPAKGADYAGSVLAFNIYDTLVLPKQGAPGAEPHLAESWTVDGPAYTFKLRSDVKFQSGNPLTAEDVVFSLDRMKALKQGLSFLFDKVKSVEALDPHTVKFTLSEAYAPFLPSLYRLPILDKKLVMANLGPGDGEMKDWGQAYLSAHGAGTGAYKVVSHNPQQETVLAKNPDYFLGLSPKAPDIVHQRYGLEAATVRTLMAQGQHDLSSQWLPPEVLKALAGQGLALVTEDAGSGFYIKMNTTKKPLDDVNCRLALAKAFDYDAGLKMVAVTAKVAQGKASHGAIPAGLLGYDPAAPAQKRDLAAAKDYLAKCKYKPSDFTLELSWVGEVPLEERFALLMQANFSQIGIKSEIKKIPWALFSQQVTKPENTPNISQVFVATVTGDPDTLLWGMYHSSAAGTWQSPEYLKDAKVDALLEKGRTASSDAERAAAYKELNQRLLDLAPDIFALDQTAVFAETKRVSAPALSDPTKAFGLSGMNFAFRLMEVTP